MDFSAVRDFTMPRKRRHEDSELDASSLAVQQPGDDRTLSRLRNMWEFANLMQYIHIFGSVVKIDPDLEVEVRDAVIRP